VIDTNITGTLYLIQKVGATCGRAARAASSSSARLRLHTWQLPGCLQRDQGLHRLLLLRAPQRVEGNRNHRHLPDARATETEFFERADMMDTKVGQSKKDDPADVARTGFDAMMNGEGDVVAGWKNKLTTVMASVTPAGMLAEQHRKMAEPGSGTN
jgi:hypothetical protein